MSAATPAGEADFTVIDRVIDTNLKGAMFCTYAVLPSMMERRAGRIINVASTAGIQGEHIAPPWNEDDASHLIQREDVAELVEFVLRQRPNTLYKQVVFFPMCECH